VSAPFSRRLVWTGVFAVAFAYVESAVVVYLRAIYYPEGFAFPITLVPDALSSVEIGREAATIVMLIVAGALAGSDLWERFLLFCIAFGVWDIFYYVWLWVFLRWPPSLLTWDILFLLPVPWVGPVLAPVLVAVAMIACCGMLLRIKARGVRLSFGPGVWALAVAGGLVVLASFMIDFRSAIDGTMPQPFRWWLFGAGMAAGLAAFAAGVRGLRAEPGSAR